MWGGGRAAAGALAALLAALLAAYWCGDAGWLRYLSRRAGLTANRERVFTPEELRLSGGERKRLLLGILGHVFDVTRGKHHYQPGATYHYFVGKDASRSFITGDFSDTSVNQDDVLDLSCSDLSSLESWLDTYFKQYMYKGKLKGRYYDEYGDETNYKKLLDDKMKTCKMEEQVREEDNRKYPPCNMEWSANDGSRVWCTHNSGGITRDWAGVPRLLYTPGENDPHCVCVNLNNDNSLALMKEYENCPPTSTSCIVNS